jgi:hypothetical protein
MFYVNCFFGVVGYSIMYLFYKQLIMILFVWDSEFLVSSYNELVALRFNIRDKGNVLDLCDAYWIQYEGLFSNK